MSNTFVSFLKNKKIKSNIEKIFSNSYRLIKKIEISEAEFNNIDISWIKYQLDVQPILN